MSTPTITDLYRDSSKRAEINAEVRRYRRFHAEAEGGDVEARKSHYEAMVNQYYDVATDFYEFGWGQSFHFAPRHKEESFEASIARHEYYLAHRLALGPPMRVLDVGCGVGGPMRAIARFSGAHVTGVNNNQYQIERGRRYTERAGLRSRCEFHKADFMDLPFAESTFDAAYAIEATCHAPDRARVFSEIHRVLRPGTLFSGYEWCLTERFDAENEQHRQVKKGIEEGNALPDLTSPGDVLRALSQAGFEIVESRDLAETSDPETPWYLPLAGPFYSLSGFRRSPVGRWVTQRMLRALELVGITPRGAAEVSTVLSEGADALVRGGELGIFTPLYFFLARKP